MDKNMGLQFNMGKNLGLQLRMELADTAVETGLKIYSDDLCSQALAWLLVFGGGNSEVVYGKASGLFLYAQRRAKLYGGEVPEEDLIASIQEYYRTLVPDNPQSEQSKELYDNPPAWVWEFEERFEIGTSRPKRR